MPLERTDIQSGNGSAHEAPTPHRDVWTVGRLLRWTEQYFAARGSESPRLDAEVLLAKALGCQRIELYVQFDKPVQADERAVFREFVRRRAAGEPVAYIVGRKEFFALEFEVGPGVLIPRPDSEFVVMAYLEHFSRQDFAYVADVGTGSGNLAVSIAREHLGARVVGTDISAEALRFAARNVQRHEVQSRIALVRCHLLSAVRPQPLLDAIVSNPPYIPSGQIGELEPGVRDYEPRVALDGGPDGLRVVGQLICQALRRLKPQGLLIIEIGAPQERPVLALLVGAGFEPLRTVRDYAGHPRVLVARKPSSEHST